jgi:alkanesulfonate monooxygenase SsuD/methylene tetrahydromethanopterin reductase-like flavin-dependent oxidoreductase (luciferase family)
MKVGVLVSGGDVRQVLVAIRAAEDAGLDCAWSTSGPTTPDPLAAFAAAATQTTRIRFGTAILHTFPRHPVSMAATALAVDQLAPGRLTLGVGPSGGAVIGPSYGIPFERPQQHLGEYLTVLRELLGDGKTGFQGSRLSARAQLAGPTGVRVIGSALRAAAFELCGRTAHGAVSWLCPAPYLARVARPALNRGAGGGAEPILVGHVAVCHTADREAARAAVRAAFGFFPRVQTYQDMFADAGFPEARATGQWSDAMCDAVCVSGEAAAIEAGLRAYAEAGVDEAMVSVLSPGGPSITNESLGLLGSLNRGRL